MKPIKMYGKCWEWLGCIQPMCSAPGHSWQGPFFFSQKSAPFLKKCIFGCLYDKASLFIIKRADTSEIRRNITISIIFWHKQGAQSNLQKKKFTVYCSYLQVYKEKIYDLLNKSHVKGVVSDGPGLKLKWNKNDVFSVENLYTFECKSIDDVLALYHFGIKNKVIASHNMNNSSSRSHSMLSLTVE